MKKITYIVLFFSLACASPKMLYDYDVEENFSKHKTFAFFNDVGETLSSLDKERILRAIKKELLAKGLQESAEPDFYIYFGAEHYKESSRNTVGIGIGGSGRNVGFGISGGIPIGAKRKKEQLKIDFVTAKKDQLFWQVISESTLKENIKPAEKTSYYQKIITKALEKYPPKK